MMEYWKIGIMGSGVQLSELASDLESDTAGIMEY
jgi:hypothetical protein